MDNQPNWYSKPNCIRKTVNHIWTNKEVQKINKLRNQKVSVSEIIAKLHLTVNTTQVYNVIRKFQSTQLNKCYQCGRELSEQDLAHEEGKLFKKCHTCYDKNAKLKAYIRDKNIRNNLCACCGKVPPMPGKKTCKLCLSYTHRSRIAQGLCGRCGKHPIDKKNSVVLCKFCLILNRENTNRCRTLKEQVNASD